MSFFSAPIGYFLLLLLQTSFSLGSDYHDFYSEEERIHSGSQEHITKHKHANKPHHIVNPIKHLPHVLKDSSSSIEEQRHGGFRHSFRKVNHHHHHHHKSLHKSLGVHNFQGSQELHHHELAKLSQTSRIHKHSTFRQSIHKVNHHHHHHKRPGVNHQFQISGELDHHNHHSRAKLSQYSRLHDQPKHFANHNHLNHLHPHFHPHLHQKVFKKTSGNVDIRIKLKHALFKKTGRNEFTLLNTKLNIDGGSGSGSGSAGSKPKHGLIVDSMNPKVIHLLQRRFHHDHDHKFNIPKVKVVAENPEELPESHFVYPIPATHSEKKK